MKKQCGAVLIFALILLVAFLITSVGAINSTLNNVASSGNFAFREGALAVADSVIPTAKTYIDGLTNTNTSVAGRYSSYILIDKDDIGIPNDPCTNQTSTDDWSCVTTNSTDYAPYSIQYFIERLCTDATSLAGTAGIRLSDIVISDIASQCQVAKPTTENGGSYSLRGGNQNGNKFEANPMLYRVTVKVTGPKNTTAWTQAIISK